MEKALGITPAYAGKRETAQIRGMMYEDHPRIRGEKRVPSRILSISAGSPPHTRGKGISPTFWSDPKGITPAYAGKRPVKRPAHGLQPDHPRIRGEKGPRNAADTPAQGSPPHTRGKVSARLMLSDGPRITPAYAGKSKDDRCQTFNPEDHPRIRGEKDLT